MKKIIQLYTTTGCHLCEQAEAMFHYLIESNVHLAELFELRLVEISTDEKLVERFGIRIPVLAHLNNELSWPFELQELENWLISSDFSKIIKKSQ